LAKKISTHSFLSFQQVIS